MSAFGRVLRNVRLRLQRWITPAYRTVDVAGDLPKRLRRRTVYVVEEDGFLEQAAMLCPCSCGRILQMNLLADERPWWRLTRHVDGTASLDPSVWRKRDCGAHFWFRRGRVTWCGAVPRQSLRWRDKLDRIFTFRKVSR